MCGITGFIDFKGKSDKSILKSMVSTLNHRGPDDEGLVIIENKNCKIGLGHRRLSIIDLTLGGHQPMRYKNLWIVFNGEIYNYKEIRKQLLEKGHNFNTNSDTEVILHSYEQWGFNCQDKFIGMFAFLIYDINNNIVFCSRDRAGVKPFYYYYDNDIFIFGSELKAIMKHNAFKKEIDINSTNLYFYWGYIPSPYSIFNKTRKLDAGNYLTLNLVSKNTNIYKYWDVKDFYEKASDKIPYEQAKNDIHNIMKDAYMHRMVSDVPVGVFLSGGYDSTSVAAILQNNMHNKLKTFTIGFNEGNNEAPAANKIAKYLGTEHYEYYCTSEDAKAFISNLPEYYDEPFADSSAIPTTLLSKFARKYVSVALSADGGDEIFGGYSAYIRFMQLYNKIRKIPKVAIIPTKLINYLLFIFKIGIYNGFAEKIDTLLSLTLKSSNKEKGFELYKRMLEFSGQYNRKLLINYKNNSILKLSNYKDVKSILAIIQAIDFKIYLQGDILVKVDRASMAHSLEAREPLLDHRIIEYAATNLIDKYKIDNNIGKIILRDIVHEYIPHSLLNQSKKGFTVPIDSWLRNDLSYLIEEYLNDKEIKKYELFNRKFIKTIKERYMSNKLYNPVVIWKILVFQMWMKKWI